MDFDKLIDDLLESKEAISKNAKIATQQNEKLTKLDERLNLTLDAFKKVLEAQISMRSDLLKLSQSHNYHIQNGIDKSVKEATKQFQKIPHVYDFSVRVRNIVYSILVVIIFIFISVKFVQYEGLKNKLEKVESQAAKNIEYQEWIQKNYPKASEDSYYKWLDKQ